MQPNSYANERNYIPHDPDEKDRELDLAVERYLPNSEDLSVGTVLWFPEKKLRNLISDFRLKLLGSDLKPWIGWAELKTSSVVINAQNPSMSYLDLVLRFEHSGQALSVQVYVNTPWVARV